VASGEYALYQNTANGVMYVWGLNGTPAWTTVTAATPAVRCYNSANISIATATVVALTFNTNRYDQGTSTAQHSTGSNTSRLVCQTAGIYHITGLIQFNGDTGGVRRVGTIRLNGSTTLCQVELPAPTNGSNFPQLVVTCDYALVATDYVELVVYQDSGSAVNVNAAANGSPEFMWHRVG
jgi:hypothetical protein